MPSILNLKFKGNKSFVAFSNLADTESLTKTWKVCTKVASYLEQGQRLENLSWRLWHLQNLMVDTDNAKSKREFKKLSKVMGDKLDKEKGRSIEELEAPDFKRNHSTEMIKQRAIEKERNREASQNATPGTIKRMQFTFSVDQPAPASNAPVKKPDTKPSAEFAKRTRAAVAAAASAPARAAHNDQDTVMADASAQATTTTIAAPRPTAASVRLPNLFSDSFGPSALLYATPTLTTPMTYGEGFMPSVHNDQFSISRPTIELALDEFLFNDEPAGEQGWASAFAAATSANRAQALEKEAPAASTANNATSASAGQQQDVVMASASNTNTTSNALASTSNLAAISSNNYITPSISSLNQNQTMHSKRASVASSVSTASTGGAAADDENGSQINSDEEDFDQLSPAPSTAKHSIFKGVPPLSATVKEVLPETIAPSRVTGVQNVYGTRSSTPTARPALTLRTQTISTRSSGPSATATSLNPAVLRGGVGNSAPGGVKAECSNCGATHTPLWRRGLNDELNCNACGLYCKLHKRPRPKSMRNSHGEGRAQAAPRQETVDVMARPSVAAQCYNCHTTATPLWRKDDEGKTVCNACGLYYKLHGSARPISMKSDVIRKRSRHDARRGVGAGPEDTPSASPGVSRRTSPVRESSPTLAPDSTTQMSYDFSEDTEFRGTTSSSSELLGALGGTTAATDNSQNSLYNPFQLGQYPGPYHPDYLMQLYNLPSDALPFAGVDTSSGNEMDHLGGMGSPRSTKRRRMSTDSASEPPSSAVSYSSYGGTDGYSSAASSTTSHSKRSSMDSFPFSTYNTNGTINQGPALRGSGNTFWHPPMMPQGTGENEVLFHPPMLPPSSGSSVSGSGSGGSGSSSGSNSASGTPNSSANASSTDLSSVGSGQGGQGNGGNEDSPMDYLHPPMALQDEESLFSAYLHPPMVLPEEKHGQGHDDGHQGMYVDFAYP
ncbi:unnamed protein product [Cyclocybe aegerita]|uniref:GATA-type domain-containing protein n=1 Tax=Cyclocybe aegerita TaxID=1973307 RepID=A0A8S0VUK0_CYCAE|nr:unnamed protein product [Cyclocybe aegerita]